MDIIIFFIYLLVMQFVFRFLDNKYNVVFLYEGNKGFKRGVNYTTIIFCVLLFISMFYARDLRLVGVKIAYIQGFLLTPYLFRAYIVDEIKRLDMAIKQRKKDKDVDVDFCYYCGGPLNETNKCPNCGEKIE